MFLETQQSDKMAMENKKGSILAYSLIIIAAMLAIASSLSVTAVIEKKSASGTEFSMQSIQTADSGVQLALKKLNAEFATPSGAGGELKTIGGVNGLFACSADNKVVGADAGPSGSSYEMTFFDNASPAPNMLECDDVISKIASIHSIGKYKNTVRAVDVSVAPPAAPCDATTVVNSFCSFEGLIYGTVMAANGEIWLDRNLGATQVASSSDDDNSYGHFYQWGRGADGHQFASSATVAATAGFNNGDTVSAPNDVKFITSSVSTAFDWRNPTQNNTLWQAPSRINNPCPNGFHVPTATEWTSLATAESIVDPDTAFSSTLKLPVAGYRSRGTGGRGGSGIGYFWASTINGASTGAQTFRIQTTAPMVGVTNFARAYGFSVRCIKD